MSSPYTRLMTEDEELMYDAGLMDGAEKREKAIIKVLEELFNAAENAETRRLLTQGIALIKKQGNLFPQEEVDEVRQALSEMISGYGND